MWKVLKSEKVFDDLYLEVYKEKLELPDGQQIDWIRFGDDGAVVTVLAQREDKKFLITKEYSYPNPDLIYDLPGGFSDANEELLEAARREMIEETGFKPGQLELLGNYLSDRRRSRRRVYCYLGTELTEEYLPKDLGEHIEINWLTADEIEQLIAEGKILSPRLLVTWLYYKLKYPYPASSDL